MTKFWQGTPPKRCQLCGKAITDTFVDGAVANTGGRWAYMDPDCHKNVGLGLGTGIGQKYVKQADGRFAKAAG